MGNHETTRNMNGNYESQSRFGLPKTLHTWHPQRTADKKAYRTSGISVWKLQCSHMQVAAASTKLLSKIIILHHRPKQHEKTKNKNNPVENHETTRDNMEITIINVNHALNLPKTLQTWHPQKTANKKGISKKWHLSLKTTMLAHAVNCCIDKTTLQDCHPAPLSQAAWKKHKTTQWQTTKPQGTWKRQSWISITLWSSQGSARDANTMSNKNTHYEKRGISVWKLQCSHMQLNCCIDKTTLQDCHPAPLSQAAWKTHKTAQWETTRPQEIWTAIMNLNHALVFPRLCTRCKHNVKQKYTVWKTWHLSLKTAVLAHAVKLLHRQNYSPRLSSCATVRSSMKNTERLNGKPRNHKEHGNGNHESQSRFGLPKALHEMQTQWQTKINIMKNLASQFENCSARTCSKLLHRQNYSPTLSSCATAPCLKVN